MSAKSVIIACILAGFVTSATAYSFRQKVYIPRGMFWTTGQLRGGDADHDGQNEAVFTVARPETFCLKAHIWETRSPNRYTLAAILGDTGFTNHEVGQFDGDSLTDIIGLNYDNRIPWEYPLAMYESPDCLSHPTQLSWQWVIPVRATPSDFHICDLDNDHKKEIFFSSWGEQIIYILENCGNNRFSLVWCDTVLSNAFAHAFGDFDRDGRNEFITTGIIYHRENIQAFECTGDNQYQRTWFDTLPTANNKDNIATDDLDQDGQPEFVVGSFWLAQPGPWTGYLRIYEATSDNTYDVSYRDTLPDIRTYPDWYTSSGSGDVDADGVDELVWAVANNWMVYKAYGNNQFNRIYTGYPWPQGNLHNATNILVYDLNKNGYCEIVESGGNETHIFEIEGARVLKPDSGQVWPGGSQQWIRWRKFDPPGADSFTLFVSFNNGRDYSIIAALQHSTDSSYLWSVPNLSSDSCKIMIWSYGPPRSGQNTPRGIAWDFSGRFSIQQTAIEEVLSDEQRAMSLRILQNPTTTRQGIRCHVSGVGSKEARLRIYDVAGQLVQSVALSSLPSALCSIALHPGVYFVRLEAWSTAGTDHKRRVSPVVTNKVVVVE